MTADIVRPVHPRPVVSAPLPWAESQSIPAGACHTTTHRQLVVLPGGGVLVDTPGLREVGLWQADDGVDKSFTEITELLAGCRFRDCSHASEPGCALVAALTDGRVSADRVASWRKLHRELDWLAARDDPRLRDELRAEERRRHREYAQARKHARRPR